MSLDATPVDFEEFVRQGNAWAEQGRLADAIEAYVRAIELNPGHAPAHNNLGVVLRQMNHLDEAESCFRQAIALDPNYADAYRNLGVVHQKKERNEAAAQAYLHSLQLDPNNAAVYSDLGNFLFGQKRLDEAIQSYEAALSLKPDFPVAEWNRGLAYLMKGELEKGWAGNELRLHYQHCYPHAYAKPRWDGTPFPGKRLLIFDEIGYGDVFQFVRYLPMVKARGGTVLFEAKPGLRRLLQGTAGIDVLLERRDSPVPESEFDLYLPMESLPCVFRTALETIPRGIPYLQAPADLIGAWGQRLAAFPQPRIGVAWAGNPSSGYDRKRSCQVADFLPLFHVDGFSWFSLQKGEAEAGLQGLAGAEHVVPLGREIADFADTAAIISHLDLVISVETAVPHLAGALGKPVWLLLPWLPAWRWMLDRDDSPWYPQMRLFRQSEPGIWHDVVRRIAAELAQWPSTAIRTTP